MFSLPSFGGQAKTACKAARSLSFADVGFEDLECRGARLNFWKGFRSRAAEGFGLAVHSTTHRQNPAVSTVWKQPKLPVDWASRECKLLSILGAVFRQASPGKRPAKAPKSSSAQRDRSRSIANNERDHHNNDNCTSKITSTPQLQCFTVTGRFVV